MAHSGRNMAPTTAWQGESVDEINLLTECTSIRDAGKRALAPGEKISHDHDSLERNLYAHKITSRHYFALKTFAAYALAKKTVYNVPSTRGSMSRCCFACLFTLICNVVAATVTSEASRGLGCALAEYMV